MDTNLKPYEGTRPYIFVSYAHKDNEQIFPILQSLFQAGYRIWYDRGIPWSMEWADVIADHVENCAACLVFHSEASRRSQNCREELYFALGENKPILSVYLENITLSRGIRMRLSPYQAIKLSDFNSLDAFVKRLDQITILSPCKIPGWNKIGQIQWRVDEDNLLTIVKNEDFNGATGTIPDYQAEYVRGGSTAPWMLYRERIATAKMEANIATIGSFAFRDCDHLESVDIPNSVQAIGEGTFANCKNLRSVTIPDSVSSIGKYAFEQCRMLSSVSIPDSVPTIEESAFAGCVSLTDLVIPDSVTTIHAGAFVNCANLATIIIPDSIQSIEEGAFLGCERLFVVKVPKTAVIHPHAFDAHTRCYPSD